MLLRQRYLPMLSENITTRRLVYFLVAHKAFPLFYFTFASKRTPKAVIFGNSILDIAAML